MLQSVESNFRSLDTQSLSQNQSQASMLKPKIVTKPAEMNSLGSLLQTPSKATINYDATLTKLTNRQMSVTNKKASTLGTRAGSLPAISGLRRNSNSLQTVHVNVLGPASNLKNLAGQLTDGL
jgi:hypothetical protein